VVVELVVDDVLLLEVDDVELVEVVVLVVDVVMQLSSIIWSNSTQSLRF